MSFSLVIIDSLLVFSPKNQIQDMMFGLKDIRFQIQACQQLFSVKNGELPPPIDPRLIPKKWLKSGGKRLVVDMEWHFAQHRRESLEKLLTEARDQEKGWEKMHKFHYYERLLIVNRILR